MGHPGLGSQRKDPDREMLASGQVMAKGRARKSRAGKQGRWVTTRAPGSTKKEGRGTFPLEEGHGHHASLHLGQLPCPSGVVFCSLGPQASVTLPVTPVLFLFLRDPFLIPATPAYKGRASHVGLVGKVSFFKQSGG